MMNKSDKKAESKIKGFYENKYSKGEEIQRTSKLYTLASIPPAENLSVLDVGCGSGINSRIITELGHSVIGVDISEHAIHKYRNRGFNGSVMDIEKGLELMKKVPFSNSVRYHRWAREDMENIEDWGKN
jgi:2-polyprenyl-3-methyl-5-hydroxy-6-metoxy-1,4-benzoquinol methylase